jgi:chitinase
VAGRGAGERVFCFAGFDGISLSLSRHFSKAVSTPESRQTFCNSILDVYSRYNLDGIDIDWEYPGHAGDKGSVYDPLDSSNFLIFLKLLRSTLPLSARISAAVQPFPFMGEDGEPLSDTSGFASVLDWVLIMNYDTWGCKSSSFSLFQVKDINGSLE